MELVFQLQEIVWCASGHMWLSSSENNLNLKIILFWIRFTNSPWSWVKLQERVLECVIQFHDGGLVTASVAVVGGGEDGDHVPVVGPVVSLHDQLMCPAHQGQTVRMVECLRNVLNVGVRTVVLQS